MILQGPSGRKGTSRPHVIFGNSLSGITVYALQGVGVATDLGHGVGQVVFIQQGTQARRPLTSLSNTLLNVVSAILDSCQWLVSDSSTVSLSLRYPPVD